jgi:hypothetical protein
MPNDIKGLKVAVKNVREDYLLFMDITMSRVEIPAA